MKNFLIKHLKENYIVYLLLLVFTCLFFYRLDWPTLASWDEGWYASISKEILKTHDVFHIIWNGKPFYDHPPFGFWLTAISFIVFGINELAARLPSAILGVLSIFFIYRISIELFNKKIIGVASSLILGTCVWYVIRVRSGNLDSEFVFFYILTVYLSIKSSKQVKLLPLALLSFGALMLTKTLVGASAVLLILFWNYQHLIHLKKTWKFLLLSILSFSILVLPWYLVQLNTYPDFIQHHFFDIGTRSKTISSYFHLQYQQTLFYLHMGIRKWYYLWILAIIPLLASYKFFKKQILFLIVWNVIVLYPFLTTDKSEIWHLIPVYIPVSLIISFGFYQYFALIFSISKKILNNHRFLTIFKRTIPFIYIFFIALIAFIQLKNFYFEVIPQSKYIGDDVSISIQAAQYNKPIYLDDDFLPISVYYSNQIVTTLISLPDNEKTLVGLYQNFHEPFVVITRNWAVENLKKEHLNYTLLYKNNTYSILSN